MTTRLGDYGTARSFEHPPSPRLRRDKEGREGRGERRRQRPQIRTPDYRSATLGGGGRVGVQVRKGRGLAAQESAYGWGFDEKGVLVGVFVEPKVRGHKGTREDWEGTCEDNEQKSVDCWREVAQPPVQAVQYVLYLRYRRVHVELTLWPRRPSRAGEANECWKECWKKCWKKCWKRCWKECWKECCKYSTYSTYGPDNTFSNTLSSTSPNTPSK